MGHGYLASVYQKPDSRYLSGLILQTVCITIFSLSVSLFSLSLSLVPWILLLKGIFF